MQAPNCLTAVAELEGHYPCTYELVRLIVGYTHSGVNHGLSQTT